MLVDGGGNAAKLQLFRRASAVPRVSIWAYPALPLVGTAAMHSQPSCPNCRQPMQAHRFTSNQGHSLELDICFACQGLWFDRHENLKLAPQSVVELFRLLHEHRTDQHQPLAERMACPRCNTSLAKGFDVVRSARVDIRKDHACPYCRAAFSLIDPDAVVRAMEGYAKASSERTTHATPSVDIGDALVALERDRSRAERER